MNWVKSLSKVKRPNLTIRQGLRMLKKDNFQSVSTTAMSQRMNKQSDVVTAKLPRIGKINETIFSIDWYNPSRDFSDTWKLFQKAMQTGIGMDEGKYSSNNLLRLLSRLVLLIGMGFFKYFRLSCISV